MSDPKHHAIATVERAEPRAAMHPLVRLATQGGGPPDPATLRELMQLQREWEAGEARKAYAQAMVALKRDLPASIEHDTTVSFGDTRYTHASHAQVIEKVTEHLTAHGFSLTYREETTDRGVRVTAVLQHAGGHSETQTLSAPLDNSGKKNPIQQMGSSLSYLRRYCALALLGIATRGMDEEPKPASAREQARAALMRCSTSEELAAWVARAKASQKLTSDDHLALASDYETARERIENS